MLLRRAGYRILLVPDSRISTEYPEDYRAYLGMWRRWIKNVLLHSPRFGAWDEFGRSIVAVGIGGAVLLGPLTVPLTGRIGLVGSGAMAAVATMNRVRRVAIGARSVGLRPTVRDLPRVAVMTLLDSASVLLAVYDLTSGARRARW
jgi:hypothetical protein